MTIYATLPNPAPAPVEVQRYPYAPAIPRDGLICGIPGLDAIVEYAQTELVIRNVVVLGFSGVQALDVVGPFDVFSTATLLLASSGREDEGYRPTLVSAGGVSVPTLTGLEFASQPLPDPAAEVHTLLLPGGMGVDEARADVATMEWIRAVAERASRVMSVCSGALLAAQAGLLDGCTATTHWGSADRLAREFPSIAVDPDPIFIRSSDRVWSAAGVTAGIDLALALVEEDYGTDIAQTVARWLVLHLRRPGGQSQFAPPVWMPRAKRRPIRDVQELIEAEPGAAYSISDLADRASMSPRHFTRVFTAEVGESPGAYVDRIRTDAARRQLTETDDTVTVVAARCGFGSAESMRRNFARRVGVSPDQFRKTFA